MSPIVFILIAAALLILVSGTYVFVIACCARKKVDWLDEDWIKSTPHGVYSEYIQASNKWLKENKARDLYITSHDGLRLHALWIPVENPKGTVLMAHGY